MAGEAANYWGKQDDDFDLQPEKVEFDPSTLPTDGSLPNAEDPDVDEPITAPETEGDIINWDAKEHLVHSKNAVWYIIFGLVTAILAALSIFLLHAITFTALIVVSAAALLVYIKRPPRTIHYSLGNNGLSVDGKIYSFDAYKAFGVLQEDKDYSIMLIPIKRLSPALTVYFPEASGESIVDLFGAHLPMQDVQLDALDKLIHRLRI
jgi:hypothetical protein